MTEFAPLHMVLKPNQLFGVVVRDIVISAGREDVGNASPTSIFKHVC